MSLVGFGAKPQAGFGTAVPRMNAVSEQASPAIETVGSSQAWSMRQAAPIDSFYEAANDAMGRMAATPNPGIYLEAMEEPKTRMKNLMNLGVSEYFAHMAANGRRRYWFTANTGAVKRGMTNERLTRAGFFELSPACESIQSACMERAVYRTVRTVR